MKQYIKQRSHIGKNGYRATTAQRGCGYITEGHSTEGIKRSMLLRCDVLKRYGRSITDEQAFLLASL